MKKNMKYVRNILEPGRDSRLSHLFSRKIWSFYSYLNQVRPGKQALAEYAREDALFLPQVKYGSAYFQQQLTNHILPFWKENALDTRYGGYLVHLSESGERYRCSTKYLAMQARMVYTFSVGYLLLSDKDYLQCARHGVRFMIDHMWDKRHGGWYRTVNRRGEAGDSNKHLFDNSYALIGLAKYYGATKDPEALDYINATCELLNTHAWDKQHGGYYEECHSDWSLLSSKKTICVHLDALAANLFLHEVLDDGKYVAAIEQLANIIIDKMMDPAYGNLLEHYHSDWRYNPLSNNNQIEFGHNLKGAWMLLKSFDVTGIERYYESARKLVDWSINHGWDREFGGFFQHGFRNGLLASDEKLWWPECEGMLALLRLYQLSGDDLYLAYFHKLIDFVEHSFNDAAHGDWFTSVTREGKPLNTNKGGDYKSAFHVVEAYFQAFHDLKTAQNSTATNTESGQDGDSEPYRRGRDARL